MSLRFFTAKTLLWGLALLPFVAVAQVKRQAQSVPRRDTRPVEVAVFSINDFHGAFIASPEKALCDYINYNKVTLRFMKDVGAFLAEDLRLDTDILSELNHEIIQRCAETGRKSGSLFTLLKFLKKMEKKPPM